MGLKAHLVLHRQTGGGRHTMSKFVVGDGREGEAGERGGTGDWMGVGEEQADVSGLQCHPRSCDARACVAAESQGWVHGPAAARVSVDVSRCNHQRAM